MDISQLPYELQFRYLLELRPEEIFQYCQTRATLWLLGLCPSQTSQSALAICESEEFWNQKAIRDTGVPIKIPPFYRYINLLEQHEAYPEPLVSLTIQAGLTDSFRRLLDEAPVIRMSGVGLRIDANQIIDYIYLASFWRRPEIVRVLLDHIKEQLPPNQPDTVQDILSSVYDEAVKTNYGAEAVREAMTL